jgi:dCMP deaminase
MASLKAKLSAHLIAARAYANLSSAQRLKVGAFLIREDRIISIGYNGMPSGMDNVCEILIDGQLYSRPEVIHAEMNAIAFAAKHGIATDGCSMVVTHSPCFDCSRLIIQSGIKKIYYGTKYRDDSGIKFLKKASIKVKEITWEK